VVPGTYKVELSLAGKSWSEAITVVRDPRLGTTPAAYAAQFALHKELVSCLSKLNQTINRLRRLRRQLDDVAARTGKDRADVRSKSTAITRRLSAIERVLVDPERKSARDVLRNPAGLADTLLDMIAMTTTADAAPTSQTQAVSREIMDKVEAEIAKLEALAKADVAAFNAGLAKASINHITGR
jgi:hypothetical protein